MSPAVLYATLEGIVRSLDAEAHAIADCGASAPDGVDAGDLTGMIMVMLSVAMDSAAGLAEGLAAASQGVRESLATYIAEDDRAAESLSRLDR